MDRIQIYPIFANKKTKKISIIRTKDFNVKLKVTIHSSGRLGFTADTAKALNLSSNLYVKFAKDDEDEKSLYLILVKDPDDDAFRVIKSGAYYYIPTTLMFESLGFDYKKYNIMFDMIRMPDLDAFLEGQVYKLNKRIVMRKEREKNIRQ